MGHVVNFPASHQEVQHLLPWYWTDTLDEDERALVEAHLADCAECRAEVGEEPVLVKALDWGSPDAESSWASLQIRLHRRAPAPRTARRPWAAATRKLLHPKRVKWVVAAQFAALVLLGYAALPSPPQSQARQGNYRALGDAPAGRSGNVLAMFRPDASVAQLRSALQASGARLVDGPTPAGAYVLEVAGGEGSAGLAALRHDPNVTMAEPIEQAPAE